MDDFLESWKLTYVRMYETQTESVRNVSGNQKAKASWLRRMGAGQEFGYHKLERFRWYKMNLLNFKHPIDF